MIEDLVKGKDLKLKATAYGTDCYPAKKLRTLLNLRDVNEAIFLIQEIYIRIIMLL